MVCNICVKYKDMCVIIICIFGLIEVCRVVDCGWVLVVDERYLYVGNCVG